MYKIGAALLFFFSLAIFSGCSATQSAKTGDEPVREAKYDEEAARLGFPAMFVSQEKPQLDWSKAKTEMIDGVPTPVIKGPVVEVCGGGCDK